MRLKKEGDVMMNFGTGFVIRCEDCGLEFQRTKWADIHCEAFGHNVIREEVKRVADGNDVVTGFGCDGCVPSVPADVDAGAWSLLALGYYDALETSQLLAMQKHVDSRIYFLVVEAGRIEEELGRRGVVRGVNNRSWVGGEVGVSEE